MLKCLLEKFNKNKETLIQYELERFDLQRKLFDYIDSNIIEYFKIKNITSYNRIDNVKNHSNNAEYNPSTYKSITYCINKNFDNKIILRFSIDDYYNHLVSYLIVEHRNNFNVSNFINFEDITNITELEDLIIKAVELLISPTSTEQNVDCYVKN